MHPTSSVARPSTHRTPRMLLTKFFRCHALVKRLQQCGTSHAKHTHQTPNDTERGQSLARPRWCLQRRERGRFTTEEALSAPFVVAGKPSLLFLVVLCLFFFGRHRGCGREEQPDGQHQRKQTRLAPQQQQQRPSSSSCRRCSCFQHQRHRYARAGRNACR